MKGFLVILLSLSAFATVKLTTFNAGLAHTYVPWASERTPHIIDALKSHNGDVLCLQEVWKKEDRNNIIASLQSEYPYNHFTKIKQERASKRPVCKVRDIFGKKKFVTCTQKRCKKLEGDDFTNCVITKCQDSLVRLKNKNRQCAAALMAQVGKSSLAAIWAVINLFKKASMFSYGGGNGLLILSKKPIVEKSLVDMTNISTLSRRQSLVAEIEELGSVYCTHLSANLDGEAPYAGQFDSWAEENLIQAERLVADAHNNESERVFMMGDFNSGLDYPSEDIVGDLHESYRALENGFYNHFADNNPRCTFCTGNNVNTAETSSLIDHIFVKGAYPISSQREFDQKITASGKEMYLSDHFGVSTVVELQ